MCVNSLLLQFNSDKKQYTYSTFHLSVRIWLHRKSHQGWSVSVVVGGPACRDRNDHQPPRSSYVSDTVLF